MPLNTDRAGKKGEKKENARPPESKTGEEKGRSYLFSQYQGDTSVRRKKKREGNRQGEGRKEERGKGADHFVEKQKVMPRRGGVGERKGGRLSAEREDREGERSLLYVLGKKRCFIPPDVERKEEDCGFVRRRKREACYRGTKKEPAYLVPQ